jgi:predicted nuclease of predicted toxin-antitoxin system
MTGASRQHYAGIATSSAYTTQLTRGIVVVCDPDDIVFARAIEEDRIIVTENVDDFRKLAGAVDFTLA